MILLELHYGFAQRLLRTAHRAGVRPDKLVYEVVGEFAQRPKTTHLHPLLRPKTRRADGSEPTLDEHPVPGPMAAQRELRFNAQVPPGALEAIKDRHAVPGYKVDVLRWVLQRVLPGLPSSPRTPLTPPARKAPARSKPVAKPTPQAKRPGRTPNGKAGQLLVPPKIIGRKSA